MTLDNFEYLVKFKYQMKTGQELENDDLSLTDMFLALTGITYLTGDIEDVLEELETDEEKEALLDKLAWHIAGGYSTGDVRADVNKDTKVDSDDLDLINELMGKDEPTEEDLERGDLNKDGKIDEKDVKIVKDNITSEVKPEIKPEEPTSEESTSYDYIHDEASWNESFESGVLSKYYANNPNEDLWSVDLQRTANFNDKVYDAEIYENEELVKSAQYKALWVTDDVQKITNVEDETEAYYLDMFYNNDGNMHELFEDQSLETSANMFIKITEMSFPGFVQCWDGAVKAVGAKFPWICPNFDEDVNATITFQYEGKDDIKPWGDTIFGKGEDHKEWGIVSIAEQFKDNGFLIEENKNNGDESWDGEIGANNFDISKFKMILTH